MEDNTQHEPATKGELQSVKVELTELSKTVTRLAIDLSRTQTDVRQIKDDIATKLATKDDINRIMNALDTYTAEAISYRNRDTLRGGKIMEHETKIINHESRLVLLETHK